MIIMKVKVPDIFVPEEKEYQMYCAVKLYKGKYINKEEAENMCGFDKNNKNKEQIFDELLNKYEKRYKKLCGDGYADGDFREDIENEKKGKIDNKG